MAELKTRDLKLIQYLNEAYGKEKQLETSLQAHIKMAKRDAYKKRLRDHLKETKDHARQVQRRIKDLGGKAERAAGVPGPEAVVEAASAATGAAQRAAAAAKGPFEAVRGLSDEERQLKNAKSEYSEEAEEIATYTAIETLAESLGDRDTAKLARGIRREEERMANFLERQIPMLTKEVVRSEIPAGERRAQANGARTRRRAKKSSPARGKTASANSKKSSGVKRGKTASASTKKSSGAKRGSARRSSGATKSRASSSSKRTARRR